MRLYAYGDQEFDLGREEFSIGEQAIDWYLFARACTRRRLRCVTGKVEYCVASAPSLACSKRVETCSAVGHGEALSWCRKGCPRGARSRSLSAEIAHHLQVRAIAISEDAPEVDGRLTS